MVICKKFLLEKRFDGLPKDDDFKLVEEELPPLKDGQFLVEAEYLSVDPYMRVYVAQRKLGSLMIGGQVGKIIESKHPDYPVGKYCFGYFGWRTHTIHEGEPTTFHEERPYIVEELNTHPMSLYLGILGMPGNTAYFGFLENCKPKEGETVVISGAAGAVGSHVGQIAKLKGCKVIGIAGSEEKGQWLRSLGFDHCINYKTDNLKEVFPKYAPNGVDSYFDNVGGAISSSVIYNMNMFGRIAVCGSISSYNDTNLPKATILQPAMVMKLLEMKGLHATQYADKWQEGIKQNKEWLLNGEIKYREHVTEGFENMPKALRGMLMGENVGKAVVKVAASLELKHKY